MAVNEPILRVMFVYIAIIPCDSLSVYHSIDDTVYFSMRCVLWYGMCRCIWSRKGSFVRNFKFVYTLI